VVLLTLNAPSANDLAMSPAEITEKLQLHKLKDHLWFVHPSCATTAEGLFEGLVCSPYRANSDVAGMVIAKCKTRFSKIILFNLYM
jgi:hypothetical protein